MVIDLIVQSCVVEFLILVAKFPESVLVLRVENTSGF